MTSKRISRGGGREVAGACARQHRAQGQNSTLISERPTAVNAFNSELIFQFFNFPCSPLALPFEFAMSIVHFSHLKITWPAEYHFLPCNTGVQNQPVRCFEAEAGVVEESLCDPKTRPKDRQRKCKKIDCPARYGALICLEVEYL